MRFLMMQDGAVAANVGLGLDRHPEIGRIVGDAVAEESRRRDADDGEGLGLDVDGGADDGGIGGVFALPCFVAEHRGGAAEGVSSLSAKTRPA